MENSPDELTLNAGVRVNIMEKFGDGWWKIAAVVASECIPRAFWNSSSVFPSAPR